MQEKFPNRADPFGPGLFVREGILAAAFAGRILCFPANAAYQGRGFFILAHITNPYMARAQSSGVL